MFAINPFNLIRERLAVPVLVVLLAGLTAMAFGSGWVKSVGALIVGMQLGIMVYGALIDPKFLNDAGLAKGSLVRRKE
jgi:hypothetical protein